MVSSPIDRIIKSDGTFLLPVYVPEAMCMWGIEPEYMFQTVSFTVLDVYSLAEEKVFNVSCSHCGRVFEAASITDHLNHKCLNRKEFGD